MHSNAEHGPGLEHLNSLTLFDRHVKDRKLLFMAADSQKTLISHFYSFYVQYFHGFDKNFPSVYTTCMTTIHF